MLDLFFDKQPSPGFDRELAMREVPVVPDGVAIGLKRLFALDRGDFAGESLLERAFGAFEVFLDRNGLSGDECTLHVMRKNGFEKEEFEISVTSREAYIFAGEPEGVRRGLIKLENLLRTGRGGLILGTYREKPILKRRISRCFFSPINRPPRFLSELDDGVDYYPDEYLCRLMRDGVNALWITSDFDSLLTSSYITEYGKGREKRLKKLEKIIKKCANYGIEVFLFVIEPISLTHPTVNKRHPGIAERYPQVRGNKLDDDYAFCTYSDFGKGYLLEAVKKLFTALPGLAGLMSITQGERITSCSTTYVDGEFKWHNDCPRCGHIPKTEILTHTIDLFREGMQAVKPSAEFISWTYEHRQWELDDIGDYVDKVSPGVVMMQNFEDNGRGVQLGKKRAAIDYWLSFTGPSEMFTFTAECARKRGKRLYAKMQVACSHELATVPYIPVPGIIYDKITRAKALGVEGVMESWFFGSYPCLMSKAVSLLATDREFAGKDEFLRELAALYWDDGSAEQVAKAWKYFEEAYRNIPLNVMFSYYGPMHDGVVWELSLLPKNYALSRSWRLEDRPNGDRIGECLFEGHTLDEAIELLDNLREGWKKGCDILSQLPEWKEEGNDQLSVVKALSVLFDSGRNILEFYRLRQFLGYGRGDSEKLLEKMEEIVRLEIENSKKMIALCRADGRLGYHSEAEGFKFFPEKLSDRIEKLKELLEAEFPEVRERIGKGLPPLAYYEGEEVGAKRLVASESGLSRAPWAELSDGKSAFRVNVSEKTIEMEFRSTEIADFLVCQEMELMFPGSAVIFKADGRTILHRDCITHQSVLDEKRAAELSKWQVEKLSGEGTHLIAKISKKDAGWIRFPYKLLVKIPGKASWCKEDEPVETLGKAELSPGAFGWIISENAS